MSGGGSSPGGGTGERDPTFECSRLVERVQLSSPDPDVVSSLVVDDVLSVTLGDAGGVPIIQAITSTGEIAGSLVPQRMAQLVNCIRAGYSYIARVLSIEGGLVRVEIRAAT